jgi:phi13 family phage major tail protein
MLVFGIQNVKYALPDASGQYSTSEIKSLGEVANLGLEPQFNEQEIYADGKIAYVLPSDKGLNGSLGLVSINELYEIDMGRKMAIDNGNVIDIEQKSSIEHAVYYEVFAKASKNAPREVIKVWVFGVTSGKPSESYEQNTENVNPQNYSMDLNILGTLLKSGTGNYVDENGNEILVWRQVCKKADANYSTFGDTVPTPTKTVV